MKVAVVLNAQSGAAAAEGEIVSAFSLLDVEPQILPLNGPLSEDTRVLEAARSADVLVAAGGDGTISSVARLLASCEAPAVLGVMPMGTCNDLSRTLNLPAELEESAEVIVHGRTVPMDVIGLDDGQIVINQANGGFAGAVAREVEGDLKDRLGPIGYWRASVEVLQSMPEYEISAEIDGERLETKALNLTVANARFSGGGVPVAPDADVTDGEMDIVIIESGLRLSLLTLLPRVLRGAHLHADGVIYRRARSLRLFSQPEMPFSLDGELDDVHSQRFEVLPGRLRVRVPVAA